MNINTTKKEDILREYSADQLIIREYKPSSAPEEIENRFPLRLKDSLLILVLSGKVFIDMNYQSHTLTKGMSVQLTEDDIILNITHSSGFSGYYMRVSADLRSEMKGRNTGAYLQKASRLKRAYPVQTLDDIAFNRVLARIQCIQSYIADHSHINRSLIIRNELSSIFLELGDSREKTHGDGELALSHTDLLREQFRELLVEHCCQHRDVSFYAKELCISTDYLSRIIREHDQSSAKKWINNAVITEAKQLMRQAEKTINEVAMAMNFPDQSTFGKFFKKHTGISPKEYKNER